MTFPSSPSPHTSLLPGLREKIGWLCQFVRFSALAYGAWVVWSIVTLWLDRAAVARRYGQWLKTDLSGMENWQLVAGFALHATIALVVIAACYATWRLFSGYLAGRIFTQDAAIWLMRIGLFGLAAEILDILFRPLVTLTLSAHLGVGQRHVAIGVNQNDLAFLMLLTAIIALAHIFKTAAAIAEENEGIV